jgi:hypothetical protein
MVTAMGAPAQLVIAPSLNAVIAINRHDSRRADPQHAPPGANFLRYVNEHFFDGTAFYRG